MFRTMNPEGLKEAKRLAEDLIKTVRADFEMWQQARFSTASYYPNYAAVIEKESLFAQHFLGISRIFG